MIKIYKNGQWKQVSSSGQDITTYVTGVTNVGNTLTINQIIDGASSILTYTPDLSSKQDLLVSGTNIKTINGNSLLGSGNIEISGGGGGSEPSEYIKRVNLDTANQITFTKKDGNQQVFTVSLDDLEFTGDTLAENIKVSGAFILDKGATFNAGSGADIFEVNCPAEYHSDFLATDDFDLSNAKVQLPIVVLTDGATSGSMTENDWSKLTDNATAGFIKLDNKAYSYCGRTFDATITTLVRTMTYKCANYGQIVITCNDPVSPSTAYTYTWQFTNIEHDSTKQDTLPTIVNDRYLHTNASTGALEWSTVSGGGEPASYLKSASVSGNTLTLTNKDDSAVTYTPTIPTVPTKTSDLTNDSGFITKSVSDLDNYTLTSSLSTVATSGSYNDLSNKPTIPAEQVQSNWNETDTTSKAYIQNKPTIPTVPTIATSISSSSTDTDTVSPKAVYTYISSLDGNNDSF